MRKSPRRGHFHEIAGHLTMLVHQLRPEVVAHVVTRFFREKAVQQPETDLRRHEGRGEGRGIGSSDALAELDTFFAAAMREIEEDGIASKRIERSGERARHRERHRATRARGSGLVDAQLEARRDAGLLEGFGEGAANAGSAAESACAIAICQQ